MSAPPRIRLRFVGAGASTGTPGQGRSARRESSLLVSDGRSRLLVDATRDVRVQLADVGTVDGVVLTHGHRDASGGVPDLVDHVPAAGVPLVASPETLTVLRHRQPRRCAHVRPVPTQPGEPVEVGDWRLTAAEVPHADRPRFRTYAWRVSNGPRSLVYASDVAALTPALEALSAGADLLVLDGAMYGRELFTHLRIEHAVPTVCGWDVGRILLTQIGRTAPPHEELEAAVRALCPRAGPAHDGLELDL